MGVQDIAIRAENVHREAAAAYKNLDEIMACGPNSVKITSQLLR